VRGRWRKIHDEELHDLYPLPNVVAIVLRTMRRVVRVACIGNEKVRISFEGNFGKERENLEDLVLDELKIK
jgi:hypothetical protein